MRKVKMMRKPLLKWSLEPDAQRLRRYGKTIEEMGECLAVLGRCIIQGIDETDPGTQKKNRQRLTDETADVIAQLKLNCDVLKLDDDAIFDRVTDKLAQMAAWEAMFK
jgi:NTP pyrophosphatase (non-canonical NTP hydrolase)